MTRWPGLGYEEAAFSVGLSCLELLTSEELWVHRRVETVDVLRRELARRQVTVEFTLPVDLHDDLRVGDDGPWCVPIAILKKKPLRHFDLREDSRAVPILGRQDNGRVATELLAASATIAVDPTPLSAGLVDTLGQIATANPHAALASLGSMVARASTDVQTMNVLKDSTTGYFVSTVAESYLLIALLDDPAGRRILKYSYDDPLGFAFGSRPWHRTLSESLGWRPILVNVPIPAAARGSSYHAEVVIPEELRMDAFIFDRANGELLSTGLERAVDRAALHAPDVPLDAEPVLIAAIYAERSGAPTVAAATALVTTITLTLGVTIGNLDSPTAGSSTAVVLAGSALFAGIVAQSGEHKLVRDVFVGARLMLALVALSALAAAASIAFGATPAVRDWVWSAGVGASAIASVSLAIACKKAKPLRRRQDPSDPDDMVLTT